VALNAIYLADKSALARFPVPAVAARLRPLLEDGELASCAIVDLEVLYSSRNLAHYELARRGQHRVPIPDLIVSAAALVSDLVVLHYDAYFERITAAGGARHEWVVPKGTI